MALTDDQRAMLRLLARREEGYEDIAALMGISVEEVRARVRDSLAALDAEASGAASTPEAAPPQTTPPPAAAPPPPDPSVAAPIAPGPAATPSPATAPSSSTAAAKPSLAARAGAWAGRLRDGNRRRLFELVGGGLIVLLIVLFATGTIDLGGDDDGDGNGNPAAAANGQQQPTQAELSAVDGSDAKGQAVFGRLKEQVALVIAAEGLRPSPKGSSYAISLAKGPDERVPIAAVRVPKGGQIAEQIEVPPEALGLLANGFDTMELSLVVNKDLRRILTQSQGAKEPPIFAATDILRGDVTGPIVDAGEN